MSDIVGTSGRKERRTACRYEFFKAVGCKNADQYGCCTMSSGGAELPVVAYCDSCKENRR